MAKTAGYKAKVEARIIRPAEDTTKPRILVYSRNKKGKTTFGISPGVDKTLVLDPEKGTKEMKKINPHVFPIEQWEDMELAWGYLRSGDHPYTWVCVDGLTKINNLALNYVRRVEEERNLDRQPGMIDRRDYNKSGELMKQMLTNFQGLPLGIIYTAQERMITLSEEEMLDDDASSVFYVPDLPQGVRGTVNSYVDVIARLFIEHDLDDDGNPVKKRMLQIGPHERFDTGFRSDFDLPDVLESPTAARLVRLMRKGQI